MKTFFSRALPLATLASLLSSTFLSAEDMYDKSQFSKAVDVTIPVPYTP